MEALKLELHKGLWTVYNALPRVLYVLRWVLSERKGNDMHHATINMQTGPVWVFRGTQRSYLFQDLYKESRMPSSTLIPFLGVFGSLIAL